MKKYLFLVAMISLIGFTSFAQWGQLLPMGVSGDPTAENMLNPKAAIIKEGIKKFTVIQRLPIADEANNFARKTVDFNPRGNIAQWMVCWQRGKDASAIFCVEDSIIYDAKGRQIKQLHKSPTGSLESQLLTEYTGDNEITVSVIGKFNSHTGFDTAVIRRYFNEKAQMIKETQIRKGEADASTTFVYNDDGLPDSIMFESAPAQTMLFKRSEKRKQKVITMDTERAHFDWSYNLFGQCFYSEYSIRNPSYLHNTTEPEYLEKFEVNYYYNPDGTLSKVTEKRSKKNKTTKVDFFYSYSK